MNFYLKDVNMELTAYKGKMMPEGALTSFALYDACFSIAPHAL